LFKDLREFTSSLRYFKISMAAIDDATKHSSTSLLMDFLEATILKKKQWDMKRDGIWRIKRQAGDPISLLCTEKKQAVVVHKN